MGGFLSGVFGTDSSVNTGQSQSLSPYQQNYQQVYGQQQDLARMLQNQAAGGGPNPAQMQLMQNSQMNAQQAATNNANNRSLNPGLAARMSGNMGVQANQQGAAQAGIQQAQQQLASQGQLSNLYGTMGNQAIGAQNPVNQANAVNAGVASGNQQQAGKLAGGALGGLGLGMMAMSKGGTVPRFADGGDVTASPQSSVGQFLKTMGDISGGASGSDQGLQGGMSQFTSAISKKLMGSMGGGDTSGLTMPALGDSAGFGAGAAPSLGVGGAAGGGSAAASLAPLALAAYKGGMPNNLRSGGNVQGKASVKGDSLKNDTVPAMLSPQEIVIPRHITTAKNAPEKAAKFVAAVLARQKMRKS